MKPSMILSLSWYSSYLSLQFKYRILCIFTLVCAVVWNLSSLIPLWVGEHKNAFNPLTPVLAITDCNLSPFLKQRCYFFGTYNGKEKHESMYRWPKNGRSRWTFNSGENKMIGALSSEYWIQIADLEQLPGL